MIFEQLSLNYFSNFISRDEFLLFSNTMQILATDGTVDVEMSEKKLLSILFENKIPDNFFKNRRNLVLFCSSLPLRTQELIISELGINTISEIEWDEQTSDFFIERLLLHEKFKLSTEVESVKRYPSITTMDEPDVRFKALKEYQYKVYFEVYNYLKETPFARCIIQMPTGSGKTRTAMEIICEYINETGREVLWLANTQELCDQAFETFLETWYFLRRRKLHAINHLTASIEELLAINDGHPRFHVATIQSINSKSKISKFTLNRVRLESLGLIVVDEAHISIAPTYQSSIETLLSGGDVKLIGLTATPGRQLRNNSTMENDKLSDFYYNQLFTLKTPFENPIEYLQKCKILSKVKYYSIEGSTVQNLLSPSELNSCMQSNTIPKKIEKILTHDATRNAVIFNNLVRLLNQGKKIIFFATSIDHSMLITSLVRLKGYSVEHVDGNTGRYRKQIIDDFKNDKLQILCNYGVLSTGFDDPQIDVVFMARPTNSIVLYSQVIGRGLRGPLIGGTESCEIYTVLDNILDLPDNGEIYSYFNEYFITN
jgi:superfamily II DNA or RNA helicase